MPEVPFAISEEDFTKTVMDYLMFKEGIDVKEFNETLLSRVLYNGEIKQEKGDVVITLKGENNE